MLRLKSILCGLFFVFIVGMHESLAVKLDQHEVLHVSPWGSVSHTVPGARGVNWVLIACSNQKCGKVDGSNRRNPKLRVDLLVSPLLVEVCQRVPHSLVPRPQGFARPSALLAALGLRARSLDFIILILTSSL